MLDAQADAVMVVDARSARDTALVAAIDSATLVYLPGGEVPKPGQIVRNPALAKFFRRLLDAVQVDVRELQR